MRKIGFMGLLGMILVPLAVAGCADSERYTTVSSSIESGTASMAPAPESTKMALFEADSSQANNRQATPAEGAEQDLTKPATAGRKIIYNATLTLVTEDLNKLDAALSKLVEANKAYIADSDRTGSAGATRQGMWKVRVPVDRYDAFVKGATGLGELVSIHADSQDVSEEFFDLEAREAAKKVEEQRLLKHLADSTGKLDEILAVERELSRVRSEIERMEGRLRALANLTSLATVTITASEVKDYVPPQAPTLATKLSRTFSDSVDALKSLGESVLLAIVALVPWLPLIAIGLALVVWLGRKFIPRIIRLSTRPIVIGPPPLVDQG